MFQWSVCIWKLFSGHIYNVCVFRVSILRFLIGFWSRSDIVLYFISVFHFIISLYWFVLLFKIGKYFLCTLVHPGLQWRCMLLNLKFSVQWFVNHCLFCSRLFSFNHCVVHPSSNFCSWLPFCYLQIYLNFFHYSKECFLKNNWVNGLHVYFRVWRTIYKWT